MSQFIEDQKQLNILLADIKKVYPSTIGKSIRQVELMCDADFIGSWEPYLSKTWRLQPAKEIDTWNLLVNKIKTAFTGHSIRDVSLPGAPGFRLAIYGLKPSHEIILNKSLITNAIGFLYNNHDLHPTPENDKPSFTSLNTYTSFEPNFEGAEKFTATISELALSVYPGAIILKPQFAKLKVDGIFYPGVTSNRDSTQTILFFALFDD